MKVSELIEELIAFQSEHGDLKVWTCDEFGSYGCDPHPILWKDPGVVFLSEAGDCVLG
jgi:hypothetical protein